MDANHAAGDQSSTNPLVTLPETAEGAPNGVIVEDEPQELEKESRAETKTADEQSDNPDSDGSDEEQSSYVGSDHTILAVREEEQSFGEDAEWSDVDSEHTIPAVREEQSFGEEWESSDVDSDRTVLAVREVEQSFGDDGEGSDVDSDHTIPAVREEGQSFGMESESSEVDSDRTVPAEDPSSDEDYDDSGSDYPEGHQSRYYPFQRSYTCRPISGNSREHLEQGNLVILPESALEFLYRNRPSYPMLFEIRNDSKGRVSHCGVVEFTAEEGTMMVPGWMMENLKVEAGETLLLKSTTLEKGTFAKLQPHSVAFLATRDVKAVLEQTLGANFSCLTTGDTIAINVGSKTFYIDIVETKPNDAICIIDTDCTVEFAVPLDYKEPAPAPAPQEIREEGVGGSRGFIPFTGAARRLNETAVAVDEEMQSVGAEPQRVQARPVATAAKPENKQFQPFSGRKYTLGG